MNNKGISTLAGLCYILPMLFITSSFFLLSTNEQKIDLLAVNGIKAQYAAESALERTIYLLSTETFIYDDIKRQADGSFITYKKTLFEESWQEDEEQLSAAVYLHFFNYEDSYFTLNAVGNAGGASKRITVYIKEKEHKLSVIRWNYHEE